MLCSVTFCSFDMKKNQRKINLLSIIYLQSPPQFPTHCVPLSTRSYTSGTQYFCLDLLPPQIYTKLYLHLQVYILYFVNNCPTILRRSSSYSLTGTITTNVFFHPQIAIAVVIFYYAICDLSNLQSSTILMMCKRLKSCSKSKVINVYIVIK